MREVVMKPGWLERQIRSIPDEYRQWSDYFAAESVRVSEMLERERLARLAGKVTEQ